MKIELSQDELQELKNSRFNPATGALVIWDESLRYSTIIHALELGLLTKKFYRYLYGHEEYFLTLAGLELINQS